MLSYHQLFDEQYMFRAQGLCFFLLELKVIFEETRRVGLRFEAEEKSRKRIEGKISSNVMETMLYII